uniref:Uncharacterized protein n=1 Tax=Brassica oleracea var. oleracea TaxID=109376 RepID=A0A0D3BMW0_BRAOL
MEIERRESLSPITRAWVGWGLALSPPFLPQLHRSAVFKFRRCLYLFQHLSREKSLSQAIREGRRWRQGKRHPAIRAGNLRYRGDGDGEKKKSRRKQRWSFRFKTRENTRARKKKMRMTEWL